MPPDSELDLNQLLAEIDALSSRIPVVPEVEPQDDALARFASSVAPKSATAPPKSDPPVTRARGRIAPPRSADATPETISTGASASIAPAVDDDEVDPAPLDLVRRKIDEVMERSRRPGTDAPPPADVDTGAVAETPFDEAIDAELPTRAFAPAAPLPVPAPVAPKKPAHDPLRAMDGSLADDAEMLLLGNFDTVSQILEGAFDEAVGLDRGAPSSALADQSVSADELPVVDADADEDEDEVTDEVFVPLPSRDEVSALLPAREEVSALLPSREPVVAADPPAPHRAEPEPDDSRATATHDDDDAPDESPAEDMDDARAPVLVAAERRSIWFRVEPLVIVLLALLNYPLRFVPPRARPIVDWIALSLVFWVPIVWCVALFLMHD